MIVLGRAVVPVQPEWVGVGINSESRRGVGLVEALRDTQNYALDQAMDETGELLPNGIKVGWKLAIADGTEWEWNPQVPVPEEAVCLVFEVVLP